MFSKDWCYSHQHNLEPNHNWLFQIFWYGRSISGVWVHIGEQRLATDSIDTHFCNSSFGYIDSLPNRLPVRLILARDLFYLNTIGIAGREIIQYPKPGFALDGPLWLLLSTILIWPDLSIRLVLTLQERHITQVSSCYCRQRLVVFDRQCQWKISLGDLLMNERAQPSEPTLSSPASRTVLDSTLWWQWFSSTEAPTAMTEKQF